MVNVVIRFMFPVRDVENVPQALDRGLLFVMVSIFASNVSAGRMRLILHEYF